LTARLRRCRASPGNAGPASDDRVPPVVYGGLGTAIGELVRASSGAGIEVAVLLVGDGAHARYTIVSSLNNGDPPTSHDRCWYGDGGALVCSIPHQRATESAVRFANRWHSEVIHIHVFWLAHVALAIRDAIGTPLVYTVHSLDRAEYEIGCGPPECLTQSNIQHDLITAADRVVALTTDERELIASYCPQAHARIRIIGNGIADSAAARAAVARRRPGSTVTILYTGRFVDRKGVHELLPAAAIVLGQSPHARLVLAGGHRGSSGADMFRHWMPEVCMSFQDRIRFTGWCSSDQLNHWYAASDVLAVPSWYEPFGMVILEGMLHGLAIVASDVGGPRAILSHGVTGLLCQPRSVASLAEALLRLVDDPNLRQDLGRRAAQQVRSRWLFDIVIEQMRSLYSELV
jgi:glycogen(starch) synthase